MKNYVKISLLFLALTFTARVDAQKKFKKYLLAGSSMFVSGMLDGTIETLVWHYDQSFRPRFPHANEQFWNPAISWKNKYQNGNSLDGPRFPGSTTAFAFTTDAYHALRTSNRALTTITLVGYINGECREKMSKKERCKTIIKDFLILTAIRSAGFTLTYGLVFRKVSN